MPGCADRPAADLHRMKLGSTKVVTSFRYAAPLSVAADQFAEMRSCTKTYSTPLCDMEYQKTMTIRELATMYKENAATLRERIVTLRVALKQEKDPLEAAALRRRIAVLLPMWQEARDIGNALAHYYERGTGGR